jgi:hypothetical protein
MNKDMNRLVQEMLPCSRARFEKNHLGHVI